MKLKIYNVAHKPLNLVKNSTYQPIMVGDIPEAEVPETFIRDNTNDNIANKNPNFSELTAIYWLWKNIHDIDFIGICHYRRYFNFIDKFTFKHLKEIEGYNNKYNTDILCSEDLNVKIENYLKKGYSILPKKRKFRRTIYNQYKKYHIESDLLEMESILLEKYPEYKHSFEYCFKKRKKGYFYNMMIFSKEDFNNYCQWLFDILFELEKRIVPSEDPYQKRVFGFLSERLLRLYVYHNKMKVKEFQLIYLP